MPSSIRGFALFLAAALALSSLACSGDGTLGGAAGGHGGSGGTAAPGGTGGTGGTGMTYTLSFVCSDNFGADAGADCPAGQPCPELPLSSSTCGDLPALLGQPAIPATAGRPNGCTANLPYGNPYYGNTQVKCVCMYFSPTSAAPQWVCPI